VEKERKKKERNKQTNKVQPMLRPKFELATTGI